MMGMVARSIWKRWSKEGELGASSSHGGGDEQRKGKEMEMTSLGI
jgi:hypothetical protein